jgi:hypothetical protein
MSHRLFALALVAAAATGCAEPSPITQPDPATGTLQLPLEQPGPNGTRFRLTGSFQVDGPGGSQVIDATGAAPTVSVTLPPGLISISLLDGWTLTQSSDGGATFTPVNALLGSSNPTAARVLANQPLTVGFTFLVRTTTGDLTIGFGVDTSPRELAGGVIVDNNPANATGDYVQYAHARMDFAVYYTLGGTQSTTLADGSKDRAFFSDAMAMEFFNDPFGLLANQVGPAMAGGFLEYHLAALPDGSQTLTGEIDSFNAPFTVLSFGPVTLTSPVPLDAAGFPTDVFVFEAVPFTMTTSFDAGDATMIGQLRFRSIPN